METLIIMNYATGYVYVKEIPKNDWQSEDYEEYISEGLRMRLSDVYYMVTSEPEPIQYL